jgi:metal-sulfur cluster biosynthetic enzyme
MLVDGDAMRVLPCSLVLGPTVIETHPPRGTHRPSFRHAKSEGVPASSRSIETGGVIDPSVREVLSDVYDPCCRDKGISVVDMGLLHRAEIEDGAARVELMLTSGWCPFATTVLGDIETAVRSLPDVDSATVALVWHEAWSPERLSDSARAKLRFLPDPASVGDPASYAAERRPTTGAPTTTTTKERP